MTRSGDAVRGSSSALLRRYFFQGRAIGRIFASAVALRDSGSADPGQFAQLLAENVIFHSPLLVRAVEGRHKVARVFALDSSAWSGRYVREEKLDSHTSFTYWSGSVRGHAIESLELIVDDDSGLVAEQTTAFRPFPAIIPVRRGTYEALRDILGPEYWTYTPDDLSTIP